MGIVNTPMNMILGTSMSPMWAELDAKVVGYFNPLASDVSVRQSAIQGWPLWRMDYAVTIACTYLAIVLVSKYFLDTGARPPRGPKLSVGDKIKKEGILFFCVRSTTSHRCCCAVGWCTQPWWNTNGAALA